jgi:hypothetical protein
MFGFFLKNVKTEEVSTVFVVAVFCAKLRVWDTGRTKEGHVQENFAGRFIMSSMITNIYNKKTKGPTLTELFTATGKLKKFFYN